MLSPNYVSGSQADPTKRKGDAHGKWIAKKGWKIITKIISRNYYKNYQQKLLQKNYKLVYYDVENVGIIQK